MPIDIGMNLNKADNGSTEAPFLDRMKGSDPWGCYNGAKVTLNAYGHPAAMPAGSGEVHTAIACDPAADYPDDDYVILYEGTATFSVGGAGDATITAREPGRVTFHKNTGTMQGIYLDAVSADDPLRNVRIVRTDQEKLLAAGEMLNPVLVERLSSFKTLRYMDWQNSNVNPTVRWTDRSLPSADSWSPTFNPSGVPIEIMVALSNATKTDMWVCAPMRADDDHVRQLLTLIRDTLDPALAVHVEYANEAWNWGLDTFAYVKAQAEAKWGAASHPQHFYGYRAAQVASIAKDVFKSAPGRLHMVIATQADNNLMPQAFEGVALAGLGAVPDLFDEYAIATYFGDIGSGSDADKATVLGWARAGDAGIDAAVAAMKTGAGITNGDQPLAIEARKWAEHGKFAVANGLKLVAYEGADSAAAVFFPPDQQAEILAFYTRLVNDPRSAELMADMVAGFEAAGGTLLCAFNDAGSFSIFGTFAMLSSIYADSPRWDVLVTLAKARKGPTAPVNQPAPAPLPTPDPTPTKQPAPVTDPKPEPIDDPVDTPVETVRPTKAQVDAAIGVMDSAAASFIAATANAKALLAAFAA